MLCHVISCYIMSCIMAYIYIMSYIMRYIILCHAVSCYIMLYHIIIMLYHVIYISVDLHCIAIPILLLSPCSMLFVVQLSKKPLHIRLQKSSQQPITAFSLLRADIRLHPGGDQRPWAQRCKDTASRPLTWQEIQERSQNRGCGKIPYVGKSWKTR